MRCCRPTSGVRGFVLYVFYYKDGICFQVFHLRFTNILFHLCGSHTAHLEVEAQEEGRPQPRQGCMHLSLIPI